MELQIEKNDLLNGINIISGAVASRTTMPILNCLLLSAEGRGIQLTASNLDLSIKTAEIEAGVLEGGAVALDAKLFADIIKKLPDEGVHISVDTNFVTTIKSGRSKFHISGIAPDSFPVLPEVEHKNTLTVKSGLFRRMVQQTIFSIATDESKPVLTGELIKVNDGILNVVAIDGFRISHRYSPIDRIADTEVIVPGTSLNEVARLITGSGANDISMFFTDKNILFELESCTVVSKIINGQFMNYEGNFNAVHNTTTKLDRTEFLMSLERACLVASENGKRTPVTLNITADVMTVTAQTQKGSVTDEVSVISEGNDLTLAFNPNYLMDALRAIEDQTVALHLSGTLQPCIIRPIETGNYQYLILPLRVPGR